MKLSIPLEGGHSTESSAFQMLCCLLSFLGIFQCCVMLLFSSDSLNWKEAGRWDGDKTEQQFNSLYGNLALLSLKAFDRGINFLQRCCGQKRLLYSFDPQKPRHSCPTLPRLLIKNYCAHWDFCRDPIRSRRVFLVILQPKISAGEPYAIATSMHSLLPFLQSIMPSKGAVEAGDLWDLKCLQLSSPEGEDQRHNSYITVKEKNERPFGTCWSKE